LTIFCRFVPSPDDKQTWIVYHATPSPTDGWANRKGHVQLLEIRSGLPYTGLYPLVASIFTPPSGTVVPPNPTPLPEILLGPGSWAGDPDVQKIKDKLKVIWQNMKKRFTKSKRQAKS
jgi:hypothetical protein